MEKGNCVAGHVGAKLLHASEEGRSVIANSRLLKVGCDKIFHTP
jgi:hypothetical protein